MLRIWITHPNTSYICHHHHIRPVLLIPSCILLSFSSHASFRSPPSLTFTSNDCEEAFVHSQPSRCSYQNHQKIPKPVLNLTGRQWDTPWIHNQGTCFSSPILVQLDLAWSCKSIKHMSHFITCGTVLYEMKNLPYLKQWQSCKTTMFAHSFTWCRSRGFPVGYHTTSEQGSATDAWTWHRQLRVLSYISFAQAWKYLYVLWIWIRHVVLHSLNVIWTYIVFLFVWLNRIS